MDCMSPDNFHVRLLNQGKLITEKKLFIDIFNIIIIQYFFHFFKHCSQLFNLNDPQLKSTSLLLFSQFSSFFNFSWNGVDLYCTSKPNDHEVNRRHTYSELLCGFIGKPDFFFCNIKRDVRLCTVAESHCLQYLYWNETD